MKRSHRIALKPTPEQESLFGQHAGYARFAYNWALGEYKAGLDVGEWLNHQSLRPRWTVVKKIIAPWAAPLSQNAAKYAIIDFGAAAESWGWQLLPI
jgi:putative transposase